MVYFFIKKPMFILSFLFLVTLLLASFLYEPLYADKDWPNDTIFDEYGKAIASSPFTPEQYPPLGTDRIGVPLLAKVIQGAKYTIITAVLVSTIQVVFAFLISIFYSRFPKVLRNGLEGIVESSLYLPASIIAFLLLMPLQHYIDPNIEAANFYKLFMLQVFFLILIGLPQLIILFSKESSETIERRIHFSIYNTRR